MSEREVSHSTSNWEFSRELAKTTIYADIMHSEWFQSLTPDQIAGFEEYAAPLLIQEGLETGRTVAEELAEGVESREERFGKEVDIYLKGISDLNRYLGR